MSFLPTVARAAATALPIVGKVASKLPIIGGVVRGIGSLFGGGRSSGGGQQQAPSRGTGYGARFGEGASDMYNTGRAAFNAGRDAYMGARDAFRSGDYGGGISRIAEGIGQFGNYAGQMFNQGRDMYNAARGFGNEMRGAFGGMRDSFRSGDYGGGFNGMAGMMDRAAGFSRGAQAGYGMADIMRRRLGAGGGGMRIMPVMVGGR